jgi:phosphoenolpyruvate-protein kinase (PTS system EI component)
MFPMVATVDELRRTRRLLEDTRMSLAADGVRVPDRFEVGIMVEVPAAALPAAAFVSLVDFFLLGTDDLAAYVLVAERGNAEVAAPADALRPAVLRLSDAGGDDREVQDLAPDRDTRDGLTVPVPAYPAPA